MVEAENENLIIIQYPPKYPKSVHLYITNECNLDCVKCHYRTPDEVKKELTLRELLPLFHEWKKYGITSIAIGGGEPLLHPEIVEIVQMGREMGFFMAITTNGTILKPIKPHRVHISYDKIHPTWKNHKLIQKTVNHYKNLGCKVGINHVMTSIEDLKYVEENLTDLDNILLIKEKPTSQFTQWDEVERKPSYWLDACRDGLKCEQGVLSFHLNYDMQTSICSNLKKRIKYTTLEETWTKLKSFECEIRDKNKKNLANHYDQLSIKHEIHSKDTIDGSTTPIPLEPDPESTKILIEMFEMVLESSLVSIKISHLKIFDKKTGDEFCYDVPLGPPFGKVEPPFQLPKGKEGGRKIIKIVRGLLNNNREEIPEILQNIEDFDFEIYIRMEWEGFDENVDFGVIYKTQINNDDLKPTLIKRRLKFLYTFDSIAHYDDIYDENRQLTYYSDRFMNLFRPIREMFHERWPDKYYLMPKYIDTEEEKNKLLREMKKRKTQKFEEDNYKKMDDFLK